MDDDDSGKLKFYPDHFEASTPTRDTSHEQNSSVPQTSNENSARSYSRSWTRRKLMGAASMLNLFSVRSLPWVSGEEKVELTAVEVASLRSEVADLEEKESHLKARLEHVDEILRSARLAGYLYIRTRWTALPGELPIDDSDVDDWLPRFIVLHGSCIYIYLSSTDLSPQDSTLLSDIVDVCSLPSFIQEDGQPRYLFHMLTRQGLRYECWSLSKIQVDCWLETLIVDCKLRTDLIPCATNES
ncbi:nucleoside-diphosphate kinase [Ranunculus cassubicifolius]